MKITFEFGEATFESELSQGISLAIPMDFVGPQPNHFGAPKANKETLRLGEFVGDTKLGGGCNVEVLEMVPHCNGTHTETVGHIVNTAVDVDQVAPNRLLTATLVSVGSEQGASEAYRPPLGDDDSVITRAALELAFAGLAESEKDFEKSSTQALVLRTHCNPELRMAAYGDELQPAFLTVDAMEFIVEKGFEHLLVDLPSVDRMHDEGLLTNHHLFWNVPETTHELAKDETKDSASQKTITEMIFVPSEIVDGLYILNLQVPALCTDAAPSRPILFPTVPATPAKRVNQ